MDREIRAVFLDIDGTMYVDGKIMPSAIDAVRQLQNRGIVTVVCTGRSKLHASKVVNQLGVRYGIYFNGGLVEDAGVTTFSTPFDPTVVTNIIEFCDERKFSFILHTERQALSLREVPSKYRPILDAFDFPEIDQLTHTTWTDSHSDVYQMNVFMEKKLDATFESTFPECYVYRWDAYAVDLQRRKSDKSIGALSLLERLDISPQNAMHIGDGRNDIGLFETVGYSVAMGNATDDVKEHAVTTTASVTEDGVFQALKTIGLVK